MPNARDVDATSPTSTVELSAEEIDSMMAEVMAVDVLLQRRRPGPYDVVLAISAYFSSPAWTTKSGAGEDSAA